MDMPKLIKAREYYDRTMEGEDKKEVALELYGRKNIERIENSPEYLAIVSAASKVEKEKLQKEIEQVKRKQIKAYSNLLDKGEALMEEAKTTPEKIAAQANQRENLSSGIIENAIAWDGENRNQDTSGIMEAILV